jgi:hypothetical protein
MIWGWDLNFRVQGVKGLSRFRNLVYGAKGLGFRVQIWD